MLCSRASFVSDDGPGLELGADDRVSRDLDDDADGLSVSTNETSRGVVRRTSIATTCLGVGVIEVPPLVLLDTDPLSRSFVMELGSGPLKAGDTSSNSSNSSSSSSGELTVRAILRTETDGIIV